MSEYTEGIQDDGAAILKDGKKMTISEILAELNKQSKGIKKIVINDCLECPIIENCKQFMGLSKKVKFLAKTSPSVSGILKTCPLLDDK